MLLNVSNSPNQVKIRLFYLFSLSSSSPGTFFYSHLFFKSNLSDFIDTKQLLVSGPSFKFAINETYFNTKLRQLFESMYTAAESYDIVEEQDTYIRALALCANSTKAFQYFYDVTQGIMIEYNFPEIIQTYLDRFIFDVRLQQQSIDDFCHMYEKNLYFHVKMVTDYQYGRCNSSNDAAGDVIKCVLMHLKRIDFRRFVILTTHFEVFRYLLKER